MTGAVELIAIGAERVGDAPRDGRRIHGARVGHAAAASDMTDSRWHGWPPSAFRLMLQRRPQPTPIDMPSLHLVGQIGAQRHARRRW